jgi:Uma2 family endonuclease
VPESNDLDPDLEPLLRSPKLPAYIQQLEAALAEEQRLRQQFIESRQPNDLAEFINGQIITGSSPSPQHIEAATSLLALIHAYVDSHDAGLVSKPPTLVSLTRNDYQPDLCFWLKARAASFAPNLVRFPAPNFVAEVLSLDTLASDRDIKFQDYAAHAMDEFWLIDPEHQSVEQYVLEGSRYHLVVKTDDGALQSHVIPGFVISTRAIFDPAQHDHALQTLLT